MVVWMSGIRNAECSASIFRRVLYAVPGWFCLIFRYTDILTSTGLSGDAVRMAEIVGSVVMVLSQHLVLLRSGFLQQLVPEYHVLQQFRRVCLQHAVAVS